jgi:hypothetical protein
LSKRHARLLAGVLDTYRMLERRSEPVERRVVSRATAISVAGDPLLCGEIEFLHLWWIQTLGVVERAHPLGSESSSSSKAILAASPLQEAVEPSVQPPT